MEDNVTTADIVSNLRQVLEIKQSSEYSSSHWKSWLLQGHWLTSDEPDPYLDKWQFENSRYYLKSVACMSN